MTIRDPLDTWSTRSHFSKPVDMPDVGSHVKKEIYEIEMSVPALAKRLSISAARAYRMLRRKDWRVSELMNVSTILGSNLFAWYAGQTGAPENTGPLEQRIARLEEENKMLKREIEVLNRVAGAKTI